MASELIQRVRSPRGDLMRAVWAAPCDAGCERLARAWPVNPTR